MIAIQMAARVAPRFRKLKDMITILPKWTPRSLAAQQGNFAAASIHDTSGDCENQAKKRKWVVLAS
jgi:hypothetical protein